MWEVFFLGTARKTESQRSERRDGILREIETGCRNLVAMGVIGRNRASRGNWRDSDRSERDIFAGAKGRRRNAIMIVFRQVKKKGEGLVGWELSQ
jgi:plasmid stabilization system protein ParE